MATVTPIGDGFRGGSKTVLGRPDLVSGTLAPANVAASVLGGVSPGEQRAARNDRGTNVTIPYARVVFHAGATTALPRVGKDITSPLLGLNGVMPNRESISETDYLGAGTVGFVLGRRGTGYDADVAAVMGLDTQAGPNTLFSRDQDRLAQFALVGGGVDTNTAQRMCSIEYLESYFFHVLRKKVVNLGGDIEAGEMKHIDRRWPKTPIDITTASIKPSGFDTDDAAVKITGVANTGALKAPLGARAKTQGVFAGDLGPFLRGYTIDRRRVDGTTLATGFGDQIAFDVLQQRLMKAGLCDWTPDGIVHSKLSSGDASTDYEMDARDGQLFNVVVKGSAIAVSWTHDRFRDIMPGDQLFLVLVGDVWEQNKAATDLHWSTNKPDEKYKTDKEDAFLVNADLVGDVARISKLAPLAKAEVDADAADTAADAAVATANAIGDPAEKAAAKAVADPEKAKTDVAKAAAKKALVDAKAAMQAAAVAAVATANAIVGAAAKAAAIVVANAEKAKVDALAARDAADILTDLTAAELADTSQYYGSEATTKLDVTGGDVCITNVRPRLITSTEMMQYSAVTKSTGNADRTSRLGLRATSTCREYIIGGWSIGNVIDNSATRPIENRSALGVAKRAKTSHACNVLVNVRWWSADRMYRNFMNKEGALRSRFDGSKKVMQRTENIPASKRT